MRNQREGTVDGVDAVFGNMHCKKNGMHFTVKTEAVPAKGSKLEHVGKSGMVIIPYIAKRVTKIEDNRYRIVARVATGRDYEQLESE